MTAPTTARHLSAFRHFANRLTPALRSVRVEDSSEPKSFFPSCLQADVLGSPQSGNSAAEGEFVHPGLVHAALIRDSHASLVEFEFRHPHFQPESRDLKGPLRQNLF